MFELALSVGADIHIQNRQGLTPLTLASYLAKKNVSEPGGGASNLEVLWFRILCYIH